MGHLPLRWVRRPPYPRFGWLHGARQRARAVFTPAPAGARCGVARSEAGGGGSTRRTVLIAGAANVIVAVAKLAAGLLTGSSAMLAEAAHSMADTLNQAFLLTSLQQGNRPADERHPFGYGQERYFWSLLPRSASSSRARASRSSRGCSPCAMAAAT